MNEDRAREAVEHLQHAALEMIEAGRAFLDLAEELVKDPAPLLAAAAAAADAASVLARRGDGHSRDDQDGGAAASPRGPRPETRVQHIRVS